MHELMQFAEALARESGALILRYYESLLRDAGPEVVRKADATPVTAADREAEALLRARIAERYPEHRVVGEEGGMSGPETAAYQWILDPIDGTKAFVHGVPLFGTLIALLHEGQPVLGVINLPATGELMLGAQGHPTTVNGRPVRVRTTAALAEATVNVTDARDVERLHGPGFAAVKQHAALVRGWGDCYGHFLVAAGRADVMIDPVLSIWDVAALKPCVEGAGGRLTDTRGADTGVGTSAVSTNGVLHDEVLRLLNSA